MSKILKSTTLGNVKNGGIFKALGKKFVKLDFLKCMRLRNQMRQGMDALWRQNVPPASIDTTMKEAYRAETVWLTIRYALAWHDFPEGGQWVDFYEPMNRSDQPMPKVELKLKGEEK